jgi:hypothetical protein
MKPSDRPRPQPPSAQVPPPPRRGRRPKYPWAELELHGHFVIPFGSVKLQTPSALVEQQNAKERAWGTGRRYRLEFVNHSRGWRVWRVA